MSEPTKTPWWIPPFLGRVPAGVDARSLRILGAVALALLFEEYDIAMLTSALKQIADELQISEERLGLYLAWIRLGALPAFFVIPFADRIGRRPVFLFSVTAMSLVTFATAFSPDALTFVLLQALARTFLITGSAVAIVIVTEEFPADHRGWGIGMLAALGATGHGVSALAFSQIERLPYGWRSLYVLGALPLLLLPLFRAHVPETTRFKAQHSGLHNFADILAPLAAMARSSPARALGVSAIAFLAAIATFPSFQFSGYYTQAALGFSPGAYSAMVILGGAIGIIGNIVAGRWGDAFGRRRVGSVMLAVFPLASFAFYHGSPVVVVVSWTALVFTSMGGRVMLRAVATELFPTSQRSAASGLFAILDMIGGATGLFAIYLSGTASVDDIALVVPLVGLATLAAAGVLLSFPETHRRELEEIH